MTLKENVVSAKLTAGESAKLNLVCFNSQMSKSEVVRALISGITNETKLTK